MHRLWRALSFSCSSQIKSNYAALPCTDRPGQLELDGTGRQLPDSSNLQRDRSTLGLLETWNSYFETCNERKWLIRENAALFILAINNVLVERWSHRTDTGAKLIAIIQPLSERKTKIKHAECRYLVVVLLIVHFLWRLQKDSSIWMVSMRSLMRYGSKHTNPRTYDTQTCTHTLPGNATVTNLLLMYLIYQSSYVPAKYSKVIIEHQRC